MSNNIAVQQDITALRTAQAEFVKNIVGAIRTHLQHSGQSGIEVVTTGNDLLVRGLVHNSFKEKLDQPYNLGESGFAEATALVREATAELRDILGQKGVRMAMSYRTTKEATLGNCIMVDVIAGEYPVTTRMSLHDFETMTLV